MVRSRKFGPKFSHWPMGCSASSSAKDVDVRAKAIAEVKKLLVTRSL